MPLVASRRGTINIAANVTPPQFHSQFRRILPNRGIVSRKLCLGGCSALRYGLISQFAAIDDHVYAAMSSLADRHIENISDLSSKLATYHHDIWAGLSQKGIDNLAGHVGEQISAENLEHAGVHIQWPDTSNQAAWDLLADGHQLNVKLVADFSELGKHFAEYPDIPAVIPHDAAHIPLSDHVIYLNPSHAVDQIHDAMASGTDHLVFVDPGLSHAEVLAQTQDATDAAFGEPQCCSLPFPFHYIFALRYAGAWPAHKCKDRTE